MQRQGKRHLQINIRATATTSWLLSLVRILQVRYNRTKKSAFEENTEFMKLLRLTVFFDYSMLVTFYEMSEVSFHLITPKDFHVKVEG